MLELHYPKADKITKCSVAIKIHFYSSEEENRATWDFFKLPLSLNGIYYDDKRISLFQHKKFHDNLLVYW